MAVSHRLDTSVLTRLRAPSVRAVVEPLAVVGRAERAGISDLEIGYSARNAAERDDLVTALDVFELVETSVVHIHRARQIRQWVVPPGMVD
jgi:predicted nucleic acid-binding protein